MRQLVHTPQTVQRNMCVDLCCGDAGMTKQLLYNPDVSSTIE